MPNQLQDIEQSTQKPERTLFPLIRNLSPALTQLLLPLPIGPNLITTASLIAGIAAAWALALGLHHWILTGAVLFLVCYVLDHVDGEIARAKDQCTSFGAQYDTFVDWSVHAAFFLGLGWGAMANTGNDIWLWFAGSAAIGATINYLISLSDSSEEDGAGDSPAPRPQGIAQRSAFILRELFRADFCLIVLALALFDVVHFLLPAAAIGAHAYWMTRFIKGAREFHV